MLSYLAPTHFPSSRVIWAQAEMIFTDELWLRCLVLQRQGTQDLKVKSFPEGYISLKSNFNGNKYLCTSDLVLFSQAYLVQMETDEKEGLGPLASRERKLRCSRYEIKEPYSRWHI